MYKSLFLSFVLTTIINTGLSDKAILVGLAVPPILYNVSDYHFHKSNHEYKQTKELYKNQSAPSTIVDMRLLNQKKETRDIWHATHKLSAFLIAIEWGGLVVYLKLRP